MKIVDLALKFDIETLITTATPPLLEAGLLGDTEEKNKACIERVRSTFNALRQAFIDTMTFAEPDDGRWVEVIHTDNSPSAVGRMPDDNDYYQPTAPNIAHWGGIDFRHTDETIPLELCAVVVLTRIAADGTSQIKSKRERVKQIAIEMLGIPEDRIESVELVNINDLDDEEREAIEEAVANPANHQTIRLH